MGSLLNICSHSYQSLGLTEVDMAAHESIGTSSNEVLPWLSCVERQSEFIDVTPGEYVLRTLFSEFTNLTDRKLEHVLSEPLVSIITLNVLIQI